MQEQIEAVRRMQEYIKEHLCERISFADIAKASLYSPWHARRLFLEYTGVTPADYIRKLRLKQSALKLRDEDVKILDVALDFGFSSVESMCRVLRYLRTIVEKYQMALTSLIFRLQSTLCSRVSLSRKKITSRRLWIFGNPRRTMIQQLLAISGMT